MLSSRLLAALGLRPADAVQARGQRRSTAGKPMTSPSRVAQRGHVADLGQRDQPLVGRVVLGDHVEQVGVLRGGQPGAVEVLQPPQVQPLPGQRVHVADGPVLGQPASAAGRNVN